MKSLYILLVLLKALAIPTNELTPEQIENRTPDNIIIEYCTGIVADDDLNGIITNTESDYNYISYKNLPVTNGDIIETYLIYNPSTQYIDDISIRIDVLSDGNIYID